MFRTISTFTLVIALANIACAEDLPADSSSKSEALEIMQDHMRSELDWRSYFINRMDAERRAKISGAKVEEAPRAAGLD